jgi:large conductance mechanosensitive channel
VIFLMVKQINRLRRFHHHEETKAAEVAPPAEDVLLLREIRDSLKARQP